MNCKTQIRLIDLSGKLLLFNSGLKYILSSSACLSGLEMGGNTVCTLKIDGKHDLLSIFSYKTQLSLSRRAHEVAGDVNFIH